MNQTMGVDKKFEVIVTPFSDADRAKEFSGRVGWRLGVEVSEAIHDASGVYAGPDVPYLFGRLRVGGLDSGHCNYRSFASFHDPDGKGCLFQEITTRLPEPIEASCGVP